MIQQTSLDAYDSVDLKGNQKKVFDVIVKHGLITNKNIGKKLGWEINRVTPRTRDLVKKGLVIGKETAIQDGRTVILWESKIGDYYEKQYGRRFT